MNLDDYRTAAASTAMYPGAGQRTLLGLSYLALGLAGEVSEIAELAEVDRRHVGQYASTTDMRLELGDVLWYDAMLTAELGLSVDSALPVVACESAVSALLELVKHAGQVAEVVKKAIRAEGEVSAKKVAPALAEVRRLIAVLGLEYGLSIEEIRAANIEKLSARHRTGSIKVHA